MKNKELVQYTISESTQKLLSLREAISEIQQKVDKYTEEFIKEYEIDDITNEIDDVIGKLAEADTALVKLATVIMGQRLLGSLTEI